MSPPLIPNAAARRLFLARHALAEARSGPAHGAALAGLIDRIGFVQVDSIATVARAHHMILWSRRQSYRSDALTGLLERDRALFEHWTHDASILPIALYPCWRHRFARAEQRLHGNWRKWFGEGYEAQFDGILDRIARDGPVSSADVGEGEERRSGWWQWHPSKTALEWLWRTGRLAVTRRDAFRKVYDLSERVIPPGPFAARIDDEALTEWACASALDRLGFATPVEIARYWHAIETPVAEAWCRQEIAAGRLIRADLEEADGRRRPVLIRPETLAGLGDLAPLPPRLRILSPFDPALRDRDRMERLFGFFYRIEVFVPEAKRQYGYYVFPVLEGERLIGRLDAKAFRSDQALRVRAFWAESGVRMGAQRQARLLAELDRLADFAGCTSVELAPDWLRDPLSPSR